MDAYDILAVKKDFLKGVKGFIFDMDGTLIDSMPDWMSPESPDKQRFPTYREYMAYLYSTEIKPKPYAAELLSFLKENGMKSCICTDTPRNMSSGFFNNYPEFDNLTEFYIGSDDVGSTKNTSADLYFKAAEKLGLKTEECVVIEDFLSSAQTAKSAGFKVIGIYDDASRDDMFELKHICDYFIYNLQKLYKEF